MTDRKQKHQQRWGMDLVGYLTLASLGIGAIWTAGPESSRGWVAAVFITIGIVTYLIEPDVAHTSNNARFFYFFLQTALVVSLYFLKVDPSFFLIIFFILSSQAMMSYPGQGGIYWILGYAGLTSVFFIVEQGFSQGIIAVLIYGGGYFFFGIFGRALVQAEAERKKNAELYAELQEYVLQAEELAVAEERNRLAREVHDSIGHRLTVSAVQLEGAQRLIAADPDKAANMVGVVREQVQEAMNELRQTVATLRQPLEADLALDQAIPRLIAAFEQATSLTVNTSLPNDLPRLSDAQRLAFYRVVQEGLTNIQKHAQASQVWVQLAHDPQHMSLLVGDNGGGYPTGDPDGGFGLRGIEERVNQLGGEMTLEARSGGGAQLRVRLPLAAEGADG